MPLSGEHFASKLKLVILDNFHKFAGDGYARKIFGDKKIQVIKEVRALTGLGLKEAKGVVDAAPKTVKEGLNKEDAEAAKQQLEAAGAVIELA